MIGTFKRNLPYNSFLLIIFGLFLNWPIYTHPTSVLVHSNDAVLFRFIATFFSSLGGASAAMQAVFFIVLLLVQALMLNKLVNDQKMFSKANYLVGICYILSFCLMDYKHQITASFIANIVLIWILSILCSLSNLQHAKTNIFNIGLLLGLATLIYIPSIFFVFLVLVAMSISRPFRLTEWVIIFLGLFTPYYFIASFNFLFDVSNAKLLPRMIGFHMPLLQFSKLQIVAMISIAIISCAGLYFIQNNMRRLLVQSRNCWSLVYVYLMIALVLPFLHSSSDFFDWVTLLSPIAAILGAFFFYSNSKLINGIIFWGLLILCFFLQLHFGNIAM